MTLRSVLILPVLFAFIFTPQNLAAQDLNVYMTASSEVVGPGDRTTYTLTVTNTGPVDLNDVSVDVQLPNDIASFPEKRAEGFDCSGSINPNVCIATGTATWTVGTLSPGQSRRVFYQVQIVGNATPGMITTSTTTSATGASDIARSLDIEIVDAPGVRLHVAPESGPAEPGTSQTYVLTYGNVGTENLLDATLSMSLPEGTTFGFASDEGAVNDSIVTWTLEPLGIGGSGQVRVRLDVDPALADGTVLAASAEFNPNTGAPAARATVATAVRSLEPLQIEYAASQTVLSANESVDITLTATNSGAFEMLNTVVRLQLPAYIQSFSEQRDAGLDCFGSVNPNVCVANGGATWTVGTLTPGQTRTVTFRTFLRGNAPAGEVVRSVLIGEATGTSPVMAALDFHVDPSPLLQLSLASESGPVTAGDSLTYTITTGNIGATNPTDVVLRVPLPPETELVSLSDGGELMDGIAVWTIGRQLSVNAAGQARLTVRSDADLIDGHILRTYAELDPGSTTEITTRSSVTTSVRRDVPLRMEYTTSGMVLAPGTTFSLTLSAENTGPVDLSNVVARVQLPGLITSFPENLDEGFNCFGSVNPNVCVDNGVAMWTVGTLEPGELRTITFSPTIRSDARRGTVLRSLIRGTANGSDEVVLQRDLLVADRDTPLPVELAAFDATLNDEGVLLQWTTASETNNAGFEVQMCRGADGPFAAQGFVDGHGTTTEAQTYRFRVDDLSPGPYAFRLKQIDVDGTAELSPVVAVTMAMKEAFLLSEAAPNPFRGEAWLTLQVREAQSVRAELYDVLGRRVATLHDGVLDAGREHRLSLDGRGLSSGLYLVRVAGERFAETRRVVVAR